jgi:hypothetical protein
MVIRFRRDQYTDSYFTGDSSLRNRIAIRITNLSRQILGMPTLYTHSFTREQINQINVRGESVHLDWPLWTSILAN